MPDKTVHELRLVMPGEVYDGLRAVLGPRMCLQLPLVFTNLDDLGMRVEIPAIVHIERSE